MTSNPCLEYVDVYGRKTDLIHVAKGATYPINILGNAATADVANNPIEDLQPESTDTISFRSGDELDSKANEFTHKISKVDEAVMATNDSDGNNIAETYAKKSEAIALDPETGKVPTEYLPDTANNVNFVNGQTGTVELTAEDIPYNSTKSTRTQLDDIVNDTNAAINALNNNKADKNEIPLVGKELYETTEQSTTEQYCYRQGNRSYEPSTTSWTPTTIDGTLESSEVYREIYNYRNPDYDHVFLMRESGSVYKQIFGPEDFVGRVVNINEHPRRTLTAWWKLPDETNSNHTFVTAGADLSQSVMHDWDLTPTGNEYIVDTTEDNYHLYKFDDEAQAYREILDYNPSVEGEFTLSDTTYELDLTEERYRPSFSIDAWSSGWLFNFQAQLYKDIYEVAVDTPVINAYKYEADQVGNEFRLIKKNTTDSTEEIVSQFGINANAIFAFAPQAQVFDLTTNLHVRINMDNAEVYNMAYLEALDKSTGTWTIHNDGNDRIYVMRFGGRFNSGARISPMPHGEFIDSNGSVTFVLDSDDPYLDRNSFGLLVWKLGEQG